MLSFQPPDSLPEARSSIVVAVSQPRTRFAFTWRDQPLALDMPPTFLHWREAAQLCSDYSLESQLLNSEIGHYDNRNR